MEKNKQSPGESKQNSELDKVLKHCLNYVKEDLRKKTQNAKARRAKIDELISTRDFL